jgi:hypothetical protein
MRILVILALALAGCAQQAAPVSPAVPADLRNCPSNAPPPAPPPAIRTTAQIAQFATQLEVVREHDARARDACAETLRRLLLWRAGASD